MTRIQSHRHGVIKSLPPLFAIMRTIHSHPNSRGITFRELEESRVPRTYDPNNPVETCYEILYNSDVNGDGIVKHDEYMSFVGQLSEGEIEETNYIDLPFVIKVNFVYLSCICMNSPENQMMGSECCEGTDAGIYVSGAGPNDTPTETEDQYLTTVCSETQGAIDFETDKASSSPTDTVTTSPTSVPSRSPSTEPTMRPTTLMPTQSPSADLTEIQTNPPISTTPTSNPSTKPTTLPPSLLPSIAPTDSPTTLEPSTKLPTPMPSITPIAPTSMPPTSSSSVKPSTLPPSLLPSVTPMDMTKTPTLSLSTEQPTIMPQITPTQQPSTKAPIERTVAPASSLVPTMPQVRTTSSPTEMDPTAVPVPTAPSTGSPFPGGTHSPSLSSQPSTIEGGEAISSPANLDSVEKPDGDLGAGDPKSESLSAGGIAGIVLASALVASVALYAYTTKKRKREGGDPDLSAIRNRDLDDLESGMVTEKNDQEGRDQERKEDSGGEDVSGEDGKERGSIFNSPGEKSGSSDTPSFHSRASDDGADYIPQSADAAPRSPPLSSDIPLISDVPSSPKRVGAKSSSDDSSSCGESGWSSSAGWSSLNTASFDAGTDDGLLPGSPDRLSGTISAAGAVAAVAYQRQRDAKPTSVPVDDDSDGSSEVSYDDNPPPDDLSTLLHSDLPSQPLKPVQGKVTRDDLNAAIEAGDWAVVGATAALLADSDSSSSEKMEREERSYHSLESSFSESNDSDRRAKELERMVEIGDWEGVVLAAAQFDGTTSLDGQDDQTMSSKEVSPSSSKEKQRIRAEVESLVRRVVPDEIDNIDEMMLQFMGREDELVETLRTMQERSLAQRARAAVKKTAKIEARAKASLSREKPRAGSISSSSEPSHYADSGNSSASASGANSGDASLGDSNTESSVSDLGMTTDDDRSSSKKTNQSSLEFAIGRGDWRAVGEAAAMMGSGIAVPDELGDSASSYSDSLSITQDRVHYLDALIAKGDWAGIVHAAAMYQAMDDQGVGGSLRTDEEREALAQANMWQEIARQSKTDSSVEAKKGAEVAADWAISLARKRIEDSYESTSYIGLVDEMDETENFNKPRMQDDESV